MRNIYIANEWEWDTNPYVLAIDKNNPTGQLVIEPFDPSYPLEQSWTLARRIINNRGVFLLKNDKSGLLLYMDSSKEGEPVTQVADVQTNINDNTTFTIGQSDSSDGFNWSAIRPVGNNNLNMNVQGGGTYSASQKVITYDWKGGKENMRWRFQDLPLTSQRPAVAPTKPGAAV